MKTKHTVGASAILTLMALAYSLALYPKLPQRIPTHWNLYGQVDGWGDKQWAVFLMPGVMALFVVMIFALPWMSPRNFSVDTFRGTFNYLMFISIVLFGYLHVIMLQAAFHSHLDMGRVIVGGLFLFFALTGNVLGKVRRNFWIGVRTPWTLASDKVWFATHRLAARLFVIGGMVGVALTWLGASLALSFVLLMLLTFVPIIHSLVLYKQLEREGCV